MVIHNILQRFLEHKLLFFLVFFGIILMGAVYLSGKQSSTASAVIELSDEAFEDELRYLYSSQNMAEVMGKLGLSFEEYDMDELCSSVKYERKDENEESLKYWVRCTLSSRYSEELTGDILSELIDTVLYQYDERVIESLGLQGNEEYGRYIGNQNIRLVSTVRTESNLNIPVYMVMCVLFAAFMGFFAVVCSEYRAAGNEE